MPHDIFITWLVGIQRDLILNDNQLFLNIAKLLFSTLLNLLAVNTVITCKSFCSIQRVTGLYR